MDDNHMKKLATTPHGNFTFAVEGDITGVVGRKSPVQRDLGGN